MYEKFEKQIDVILEKHKGVEKIELNASADMKKMASKMQPLMKKAQTFISKIESQGSQIQKIINSLKGTLKQALDIQQEGYEFLDPAKEILAKVENAAKELGVKPETIDGYKELKAIRGDAYYDYKGLADAYWENVSGLGDELNALKGNAPL